VIQFQTERQLQLRLKQILLKQTRLVPVRPRAQRRAVRVTADVPTADSNSIAVNEIAKAKRLASDFSTSLPQPTDLSFPCLAVVSIKEDPMHL
jgi:hypothetical protein